MALPKVTYGNYNYGQYANPTAIRYKGGLGEGLAKGAVEFAKGFAKGKQKLKAAEEQSYMTSEAYKKSLEKALGNASVQNRQFVTELKTDVGNIVKQYKLNKISLDEYSNKMEGYNNILFELQQAKNIITGIADSKNPKIDLKDIRFSADNVTSAMIRNSLQDQSFIVSRNKDGNGINLALPTKNPSDFQIKNVSVKDLLTDNRLYTPEIKFDFNATNEAILLSDKVEVKENGLQALSFKEESRDGEVYKIKRFDPSKVDSFINSNINKKELLNRIEKTQEGALAAYYEDSVKGQMQYGEYTGSDEQKQLIFNSMRDEIKNKLLSQPLSAQNITTLKRKEELARLKAKADIQKENDISDSRYANDILKLIDYTGSFSEPRRKAQIDAIMKDPNLNKFEKVAKSYSVSSKGKLTLENQAEALRQLGVNAFSINEMIARYNENTAADKAQIKNLKDKKANMFYESEPGNIVPLNSIRGTGDSTEELIRAYGETLPDGQLKEFNNVFGKFLRGQNIYNGIKI
tara:strand:- start:1037 stop:2593 length:1557 start_codon:yes stop_codon:yes gene_type:complete